MWIGPIIILIWVALIALAVVTALVMGLRRGIASLKWTMPMVFGTVLLYGFFSAAVGISEGVWSVTSMGFLVACIIGVVGILLVMFGAFGLARSSK